MKTTRRVAREAAHLFRACQAGGLLEPARVRQVVEELAAERPRGYLTTLAAFRRLVKLEIAQHTAAVESAGPLAAEMRTQVSTCLAKAYGPGLSASFAENPGLIGGMRIQVGSDVYDGSIRGRLARLRQSF